MPHDLPKAYEPGAIEPRWAEYWVHEKLFHVEPPSDPDQAAFTVTLPPPNVTGNLHMGHMLEHTEIDIIVRWKRMQGLRTLWLPGTDHAGIATQLMVERQLAAEGKNRRDLGREAFIARVWDWKQHYGGVILQQMKRLGASVDWSREYFTMDERMSRAVREAFVRLHEEGLIYRGKYIVNWCPRCVTAVSDLEVMHEDTPGKIYEIRYPVIGPKSKDEYIVVATTRPETMLGDTAVAVNSADARYRHLHGKKVLLPLMNREIPIITDDILANPEFGTGAVKVTPSHDPNDFEAGLRNKLPQIDVMNEVAQMNENAGPYKGLDRFEARQKVLEDLERGGFLVGTKDYVVPLGKCDRCKTIVEPRLSTQWFVKIQPLADRAIAVVENGDVKFVPENYSKTYFEWMRNIHDWCISRQLWWGHRIPAWHCKDCPEIIVARETPTQCTKCGGSHLEQDNDVLDTWFSSGLLPCSALGWPDSTPDLDAFYPTTLLITGFDILFFWVARMIMMNCHFMRGHKQGDVPFHSVYIHALVRDAERQKMSKTKGNVMDPIEIIEQYGTDAVRFTLASMAAPGTDIAFSESRTQSYRAFANKIWNAARFLFMNVDRAQEAALWSLADFQSLTNSGAANSGAPPFSPDFGREAGIKGVRGFKAETLDDRWILSRFNRVAQQMNEALETYRFHEAAHVVYHFFWGEYCDWYLELIKPRLAGEREQARVAYANLISIFEGALRMLSPFMPFITEELWHAVYDGKPPLKSIALAAYPRMDPSQVDADAETEMAIMQDLIEGVRNIRAELKIEPKQKVAIEIFADSDIRSLIERNRSAVELLASVGAITFVETSLSKSAGARSTARFDVRVLYERKIDVAAERERLERELEKVEREWSKAERQLNSEAFLSQAPEKVVTSLKNRCEELAKLSEKVWERLDKLPIETPTIDAAMKKLERFLQQLNSSSIKLRPGQPVTDSLAIFHNVMLVGDEADFFADVIDKFYEAVERIGFLSRKGVADLVQATVVAVVGHDDPSTYTENRSEQLIRLKRSLHTEPTQWEYYCPVYGATLSGDSLQTGEVEFFNGTPARLATLFANPVQPGDADQTNAELRRVLHEPCEATFKGQLIARTAVSALDETAAQASAMTKIQETMDCVNFFGSLSFSSSRRIVFPWQSRPILVYSILERMDSSRSRQFTGTWKGPYVPINFDEIKQNRLFKKISEVLAATPRNSLQERILGAFRWAGRATTEEVPETAYLFSIIALENLLLGGKVPSEIGFQLKVRGAHLLGNNVYARKRLSRNIARIYGLRSRIVHSGSASITTADLSLAMRLPKDAVARILLTEPFASMKSEDELEQWFEMNVFE